MCPFDWSHHLGRHWHIKVQVEIPYEKNKNPAGDCYPHESTTISFRFVLNFEILAVLQQK